MQYAGAHTSAAGAVAAAHQLPAVALPVRHLLALRPAACHRLLRLQNPAGTHSGVKAASHMERESTGFLRL